MLISDLLVRYLNLQGAWLVAGALAAVGLYFASSVSFSVIAEAIQARWSQAARWHDHWRNWREERAELKADRKAGREVGDEQENWSSAELHLITSASPEPEDDEASHDARPGLFARLFRRRHAPEIDPHDIPAYERAILSAEDEGANDGPASQPIRPSIWERAAVEQLPAAPVPVEAIPIEQIPVTASLRPAHSAPAPPEFTSAPTPSCTPPPSRPSR